MLCDTTTSKKFEREEHRIQVMADIALHEGGVVVVVVVCGIWKVWAERKNRMVRWETVSLIDHSFGSVLFVSILCSVEPDVAFTQLKCFWSGPCPTQLHYREDFGVPGPSKHNYVTGLYLLLLSRHCHFHFTDRNTVISVQRDVISASLLFIAYVKTKVHVSCVPKSRMGP